jgi:hypothetical protein
LDSTRRRWFCFAVIGSVSLLCLIMLGWVCTLLFCLVVLGCTPLPPLRVICRWWMLRVANRWRYRWAVFQWAVLSMGGVLSKRGVLVGLDPRLGAISCCWVRIAVVWCEFLLLSSI